MMFIEKIINSLGKFIALMIPVMTLLMIVIIVVDIPWNWSDRTSRVCNVYTCLSLSWLRWICSL